MNILYSLLYVVLGLMADIDREASYEAYQEWCETTSEKQGWDCVQREVRL